MTINLNPLRLSALILSLTFKTLGNCFAQSAIGLNLNFDPVREYMAPGPVTFPDGRNTRAEKRVILSYKRNINDRVHWELGYSFTIATIEPVLDIVVGGSDPSVVTGYNYRYYHGIGSEFTYAFTPTRKLQPYFNGGLYISPHYPYQFSETKAHYAFANEVFAGPGLLMPISDRWRLGIQCNLGITAILFRYGQDQEFNNSRNWHTEVGIQVEYALGKR